MNDLISRAKAIEAAEKLLIGIQGIAEQTITENNVNFFCYELMKLPSEQPEIIFCKDCVKHNKARGIYYDGTVIGIMDCCPLAEIRGRAAGHEFDYQYCSYAERREE